MNIAIRTFIVIGVAIALHTTLLIPQRASAHTLKVDGQIGVTLHIEPDDEPVAGEVSKILIGVQDKSGAFASHSASCTCVLRIVNDDTVIDSLQFTPDESGSSVLDYTFPAPGRYIITISGESLGGNVFQSFGVMFNYRIQPGVNSTATTVAVSEEEQNPLRNYIPFVVFGSTIFVLVLFFMPIKKSKKMSAGKK